MCQRTERGSHPFIIAPCLKPGTRRCSIVFSSRKDKLGWGCGSVAGGVACLECIRPSVPSPASPTPKEKDKLTNGKEGGRLMVLVVSISGDPRLGCSEESGHTRYRI
jgi:hypothetical protein